MSSTNLFTIYRLTKFIKLRSKVVIIFKKIKLCLIISEALNHNFFEDIYPQKNNQITIDTVFDALKELVKEKISE